MKSKFVMENNNGNGGITFWGMLSVLLTILFVGLKLGNVGVVATWSWLWVLSPLWIPICVAIVIVIIIIIIASIVHLFANRKMKGF